MAGILDKSITYGIALLVVFLLASTIVMPQFSNAWRYCQNRQWNPDHANAQGANCTNLYQNATNDSAISGVSEFTMNGLTSNVEDGGENVAYYCLNCDVAGGYRTTIQGLAVLTLVMGLIGFAIYFLPKNINIGI